MFSTRPTELAADAYSALPMPSGDYGRNRFTDEYLIVGGAEGRSPAYDDWVDYGATELVIVPVNDPSGARTLPIAHSAERVELFGNNVVVSGYRGNGGLSISTVNLADSPAVIDVEYLEQVIESEGRSHAFNAIVEENGGGVFGLPTVFNRGSSVDDDEASNVHFFAVDPNLQLHSYGYLAADPGAVDPRYRCDVSCLDWYGNARPIFTQGRVFALMATELVEGRLDGRVVTELQRIGMTGVPMHRR